MSGVGHYLVVVEAYVFDLYISFLAGGCYLVRARDPQLACVACVALGLLHDVLAGPALLVQPVQDQERPLGLVPQLVLDVLYALGKSLVVELRCIGKALLHNGCGQVALVAQPCAAVLVQRADGQHIHLVKLIGIPVALGPLVGQLVADGGLANACAPYQQHPLGHTLRAIL